MGDRGKNAGGFAYMKRVLCPLCGVNHPVGRDDFESKQWQCGNKAKCEIRQHSGKYLHRLGGR